MSVDPIDVTVREAATRFGRELRIAAMGLPQRELARRAGISQPHLSRILRGLALPDLELMVRLVHAVGHRFSFKMYPTSRIRLRDWGQLELAEAIRSAASPPWRIRLEVPVGASPDLRAADVVMEQPREVNLIEKNAGSSTSRLSTARRSSSAQRWSRSWGGASTSSSPSRTPLVRDVPSLPTRR
jgi:transcriptional regulator with XRE-family HTH domain